MYQVLGNLIQTYNIEGKYVDDADPWTVILAEATFTVLYTHPRTKDKMSVQLAFGEYMILPMNHVADWRYVRQRKKSQI